MKIECSSLQIDIIATASRTDTIQQGTDRRLEVAEQLDHGALRDDVHNVAGGAANEWDALSAELAEQHEGIENSRAHIERKKGVQAILLLYKIMSMNILKLEFSYL